MHDHKGLFDLDIRLERRSFLNDEFSHTKVFGGEIKLRDVELYSNTDVRVLRFGYSREGHGTLFIRFRNHRDYDPNFYYEVKESGLSSGSGRVSVSIHNPWEAIIPGWKFFSQQEWGFLHETSNNFNFLAKINDEDAIADELTVQYMELPKDVREIAYICELKEIGATLCIDYPTYKFEYRDHRVRMIYVDNTVEEFDIVQFDRYRDGGTTTIDLVDSHGVEHTFHSPTPFLSDEERIPTWDGKPMVYSDSDERLKEDVVRLLGIVLDPREKA
jgi:hypothetical protein